MTQKGKIHKKDFAICPKNKFDPRYEPNWIRMDWWISPVRSS